MGLFREGLFFALIRTLDSQITWPEGAWLLGFRNSGFKNSSFLVKGTI